MQRQVDSGSEQEPLTITVHTPANDRDRESDRERDRDRRSITRQYLLSSAYTSNSFSAISSISHTRYIIAFLTFATIICSSIIIYLGYRLAHESDTSSDSGHTSCPNDVRGTQGMVSTTHSLATEAGLSILRAGGNAWDAAAAVQFMLNVVQPQSTGVGGGLFAMSYHNNGSIFALDGREEAPQLFNATSFCMNPDCKFNSNCSCDAGVWPFDERKTGGHPVGVPGTVAAITRLLRDFGTLNLSQVLAPAIKTAYDGFPMYNEMYDRLIKNQQRMMRFPDTAKLFFPNQGQPVQRGQLFKNPDLAKTFEALANEQDSDLFYTGKIADDIIQSATNAVNPNTSLSSVLSRSDFENYRAVYRQPIHTRYHEYDIYGMSMPSSGGVGIGMMLNMLSQWSISGMNSTDAEYYHRLIDVQDIMWSDRHLYMGDADFVDVPIMGLLNQTYAQQRVHNLTRSTQSARNAAGGSIPAGDPFMFQSSHAEWPYATGTPSQKQGTTHMVIVDRWGNVVSLTTTIEENFGSGVVVKGRGFLLNNELTDFEPLPYDKNHQAYANGPDGTRKARRTALGSDYNTVGGKRPMSSMSPTIVTRGGKPYLAMGSPGGATIIGTVLNALMGVLAFNMCTSDAIAAPRLFSQNNITQVEHPIFNNTAAMEMLRSRGFDIQVLETERPLGYVEGVKIIDGTYYGAADDTRLPTAKAKGY